MISTPKRTIDRRDVLRVLAGIPASALLGRPRSSAAVHIDQAPAEPQELAGRKLIVVVFGGGTRSSESMDDPQHRYIPRLWNEMVPEGTLLANIRVEGKIVHPNCTASLLTGREEWQDDDWGKPPAHPTVFEVYRKSRQASDLKAWAFVYASILDKVGHSTWPDYGPGYAANVVVPPTISRSTAAEMTWLMRRAAATGSPTAEVEAAARCAELSRGQSRVDYGGLRSPQARTFVDREFAAWKAAAGTSSHDAFLADRALACMRRFAPDLLVVAFGEIDCAHYGCWSRYVDAIRRTDELTCRIWRASRELEGYRGRTLMLVVPDHGRELDRPGRPGFIHHSDFYTGQGTDEGCRQVWMLAVGPGVRPRRRIDAPVPARSVAATGLEYLGLSPPPSATASAWPRLC